MSNPQRFINIKVDCNKKYQRIDGFGVNINSKYWDEGRLIPVMDLLTDDLGATLFRLDAYGKSDWVDPEGKYDSSVLNQETYDRVYEGIDFKNAEAMSKYLNNKGIQPYMTLSGVVPKWMCSDDGMTLIKYDEFGEMVASFVYWAKKKVKIQFTLLGPLNETDAGPPEGPKVPHGEFVKIMEVLTDKLDKYGLTDVKLVVAEQGAYNFEYINPMLNSKKLLGKIGVFGIHAYEDYHADGLVDLISKSAYRDSSIWMTEYGDLDQTGEREWYVAWASFQRLMRLLGDGLNGAMNWDAFDNVHDHDGAWTIYGLIRSARRQYTPKKRYYSTKQAYKFIRPGFRRISAVSGEADVPVLAFISEDGSDFTLIGMNQSTQDAYINIKASEFISGLASSKVDVYYTTADHNCIKADTLDFLNWKKSPYEGIDTVIPANSIFTFTTVK